MLFKAIIVGALLFYLFRIVLKPQRIDTSKKDQLKNEPPSGEVDYTEYEEVD